MQSYAELPASIRAAALLKLRRRERCRSFRAFVDAVRPRFRWHRHTVALCEALQRVGDGELLRLLVAMPPRSGKSELVSRLFPAWQAYRDGDAHVGIASYGASLATGLSRDAMQAFRDAGGIVAPDTASAALWRALHGRGEIWAVGVGGPATGRGLTVGIVDDPVKDRLEADSARQRQKLRDWWRSVWGQRMDTPGTAMVVVQTRWHESDLMGWLIDREGELPPDEREGWVLALFDQVHDPETREGLPDCIELLEDWREPGGLLCPEVWPEQAVRRRRAAMGEREWSALQQQSPKPREGLMFKREWFVTADAPAPAGAERVRFWDMASTHDGGDYTAGVRMARWGNPPMWIIEHVVRGQWSPADRDRVIRETAETDGRQVPIVIERDGGTDSTYAVVAQLGGFTVTGRKPRGDKVQRAEGLASQYQSGNVRSVAAPWLHDFKDELLDFPASGHDDQVDAASGAFNELAEDDGWGGFFESIGEPGLAGSHHQ